MSNIYITEPLTKGKVLLHTSLGHVDIELWSKEAPLACRNFVQLCMEGYYDGTIFHRVIRDFCAQGGDPTGTGEGGESIYGKPFKDEFHQRLKFTRRGLVAMANGGSNDNGSQFFFTLGRADELNKKHTIFGKVTGDTVYNMVKFNEIPTDRNDRPLEPPKIHKTEILNNPFDDIVPRETRQRGKMNEREKQTSQARATKNFSLLSFGEEAEEEEVELSSVNKNLKIKSSHDVLTSDPLLASQPAITDKELGERRKQQEKDEAEREFERTKASLMELDEGQEGRKLSKMESLRKESKDLKKQLREAKRLKEKAAKEKEEATPVAVKELREERKQYIRKQFTKKKGGARENETMEMLAKFQSRLLGVRARQASVTDTDQKEEVEEVGGKEDVGTRKRKVEESVEGEGDDPAHDDSTWLTHQITFDEERLAQAKDAMKLDEDSYDIYDPRNPLNKRRRETDKRKPKKTV